MAARTLFWMNGQRELWSRAFSVIGLLPPYTFLENENGVVDWAYFTQQLKH
jgi:hypothetical protein